MVSVLATYRLLPEARFPEGMQDVSLAVRWINENIGAYGGDSRNIFLIGQSAGGAHLAMALWSGLLQGTLLPRGIILQSVPFWYDLRQQRRRANMCMYYDTESDERILSQSAGAIFRRAAANALFDVPLYVTVGELDSEEIVKGSLMLLEDSAHLAKRLPRFQVLEGHNHISYALSMGLEGDEVGPQILQFIRGVLS
jgi:acetyl esterase/lipase